MLTVKLVVLIAALCCVVPAVGFSQEESTDEGFIDPFADFDDSGEADGADGDPVDSTNADDPTAGDDPAAGDDPFDEFESLFETDDMFDEIDEDESDSGSDAADDPLVSDGVVWSGRFLGSVGASWNWSDPYARGFGEPDATSLNPTVGADLRFDARPSRDYRVLGSFRIRGGQAGGAADPTAVDPNLLGDDQLTAIAAGIEGVEADDLSGLLDAAADGGGGDGALDISVFELFADFPWDDRVFFRFGKHTINWGVGFLFSPADVLNLTSINPQDPDLDLEGPTSLRVLVPFGLNSAYLFLIVPDSSEPADIAVAPRLVLELAGTELGIAGYYQRDRVPRGILTLQRTVGDVDFFGEAVGSWGSDRTFLRERSGESTEPPFETYTVDRSVVPSGTIGFRWFDDFERLGTLLLAGQYLYNGDGYRSNELSGTDLTRLQAASAVLLGLTDAEGPALGFNDIAPLTTGRHYAAVTSGLSGIAGTDVGVNLFVLANLSDFSGIVAPQLSYSFFNRMSASLGATFTFGAPGSEFGNPTTRFPLSGDDGAPVVGDDGLPVFPDDGPTISLDFTLSLGGGSF